jgi:hypothetical protein
VKRVIGEPMMLNALFSNIGKTAAYNMRSAIVWLPDTSANVVNKAKKYIDSSVNNAKRIIIGAGQKGRHVIMAQILTKEVDALFEKGGGDLFFMGKFAYTDVYGNKHAKEFFCQYNVFAGGFFYITKNNKEY